MYFMIDNYDSFVYNLSAYIQENGQEVFVKRADRVDLEEIRSLNPEGIIISPGPKHPKDAGVSRQILETFQGEIPILGVCLGHQLIGDVYGGQISKGKRPMHGKISPVVHNDSALYDEIPRSFRVTRYHSLIVADEHFPEELIVTARSDDGVIMGIAHRDYPIYGVQFHPEAVLTEYGHQLLINFHRICQAWKQSEDREVS